MNKKSILAILAMVLLVLTVPVTAQNNDDGEWNHEDAVNNDDGVEDDSDSTSEEDSDWNHEDAENNDDGEWNHEDADNNDDGTDWNHEEADNDDDGEWNHEDAVNNDDGATEDSLNARISYSPKTPERGELVSFSGADSTGSISSYEWDFDDDGEYEAYGVSQTESFFWRESHDVTLKVTEDNGDTDTATVTVDVGEEESSSPAGNGGNGGGGADDPEDPKNPGEDSSSDFKVSIDSPSDSSTVSVGESVEVDYTVENEGDALDSQEIEFFVGESKEGSETIELESGSSQSGVFTWDTSSFSPGSYDLEVASSNDTASVSTDLLGSEPDFQVSIDSPSEGDEFERGESVNVEYTVQNFGEGYETQDIVFKVNGSEIDTRPVDLDGGSGYVGSFTWDTTGRDLGDYELNVSTGDDSDSKTVTLVRSGEESDFQVRVGSPSEGSMFEPGDSVTVEYSVENTGGFSDTQDISFAVNDAVQASQQLTLEEGESGTGTFTWDSSGFSEGDYELEVSSEDDSDSKTVELERPEGSSNFRIDIDSPSDGDEFEPGDEVDVEYSLENIGGSSDTQDISFRVDGAEEDSQEVTLDAGNSETGTFTWDTDDLSEEDYDVEVVSDDDRESVTLTLEDDDSGGGGGGDDDDDDSGGSVIIGSTSNDLSLELSHETIVAGGSVEASGFAEDARAGQTVSIEIDGAQVAQTETESDGYYEITFTPEEVGDKTVTAIWDGVEASAQLEVTPSVEITSFTAPQTVNAGEVFEICVQADSQVEPQFRLFEEGDSIDSGSGTSEVCFDRALDQAGTYDYELVASAGSSRDSREFSVQVTEQADTGGTAPEGITGAFLNAASSTWGRLLISIIVGAIITVLALSIEI